MKLMKLAAVAFVIAAASMFPATAGFAQDYPLQGGDLQLGSSGEDDAPLPPGSTITVRGGGFSAGAEVSVTIESTPLQLAVARANERGEIAVDVKIPADFPAGGHTLKATGEAVHGGVLVLSQPVEVAAAIVAPDVPASLEDAEQLPRTGTSASTWLILAGLAIVGGSVAVITGRRSTAPRN